MRRRVFVDSCRTLPEQSVREESAKTRRRVGEKLGTQGGGEAMIRLIPHTSRSVMPAKAGIQKTPQRGVQAGDKAILRLIILTVV